MRLQYDLCEQAFPLLQDFISSTESGIFDVQPVIAHLARCYAATGNSEGVRRICELKYANNPDLALGRYVAERSVKELEYASTILDFVSANPGITQYAAREILGIQKGDMRNVLEYMEAFGLIRRTPTERTNRLYPKTELFEANRHDSEDRRQGQD